MSRNRNRRPQSDSSVVHFGTSNDQRNATTQVGDVAGRSHVAPARQTVIPAVRVQLDRSKLIIADQITFSKMSEVAGDDVAASALLPELIELLDRIVVGGIKHLPLDAFPGIMEQVNAAMTNSGNSKRGS